jgi:hypothetical protein
MYFHVFTRQCMKLVVSQASVCSLKGKRYLTLKYERTFLRWFREVPNFPLVVLYHTAVCCTFRCGKLYMKNILHPYHVQKVRHLEPGDLVQLVDLCNWIKAHPQLLRTVLFIDEASFTRDGISNSQNLHMWPHGNPHQTRVPNFRRRFSVNV